MRQQGPGGGPADGRVARVWVAVADGGAGPEDFVRANVPRVGAVIPDFRHAVEHLATLARALHPRDESAATERTTSWSRLWRDQGGEVLVAAPEARDWPGMKGWAAVPGYFRNQPRRMDYPTREANGWHIGSGAVGSACTTVAG